MPPTSDETIASHGPFTLSRTFNSPREKVYAAWTEADQLTQWWGPAGIQIEVLTLDINVGGLFHYKMITPTGDAIYGRFIYEIVEAPERLVFRNAFSNAGAGLERHFMSPTWPLEVSNVWTFAEAGNQTILAGTGMPVNATEVEHATFVAAFPMMQAGFNGTLDQLDRFLKAR